MSRLAVPLAALLALALPASAAAQAAPPSLEVLSQAIVVERDPAASRAFLARDDHAALRASDAALFDRTFAAANEAADLAELFAEHTDASALREALGARPGFEVLAKPGTLEAWARRHAPKADPALVRAAAYEWGSLGDSLRGEMARRGHDPERWARLPFAARHAAAAKAGEEAVASLGARMPRSQADVEALEGRLEALEPWLSGDQAEEAREAVKKARGAWEGVRDARERARTSGDPALAAAVDQAARSKDPAAALERLARIFDGLGERHPSVADAGPGRPDQRFSPRQGAQLADVIRSGVLREMRGTVIGDEVARVFDRHGMRLTLKKLDAGTQATFDADGREIALNSDEIEKWLRKEGLSVKDLLRGGAPFRDLVLAVTPVVLHEGVHLQQDVWQKAGRLPDVAALSQEVEANAREAAFILEKAARDKAYREFLAKNQERFLFVGTAVQASADLARDPAAFRAGIMTRSYMNNPSLSADAAAEARAREAARRADAARVYRAYRERDARMWGQVTEVLRRVRENPQGLPAGPPAPGGVR